MGQHPIMNSHSLISQIVQHLLSSRVTLPFMVLIENCKRRALLWSGVYDTIEFSGELLTDCYVLLLGSTTTSLEVLIISLFLHVRFQRESFQWNLLMPSSHSSLLLPLMSLTYSFFKPKSSSTQSSRHLVTVIAIISLTLKLDMIKRFLDNHFQCI